MIKYDVDLSGGIRTIAFHTLDHLPEADFLLLQQAESRMRKSCLQARKRSQSAGSTPARIATAKAATGPGTRATAGDLALGTAPAVAHAVLAAIKPDMASLAYLLAVVFRTWVASHRSGSKNSPPSQECKMQLSRCPARLISTETPTNAVYKEHTLLCSRARSLSRCCACNCCCCSSSVTHQKSI